MKILSWNVYQSNKQTSAILSFLADPDTDMICLQEVSGVLLKELRLFSDRNNYELVQAIDFYQRHEAYYLVILSKPGIEFKGKIELVHEKRRSILQRILDYKEPREALYIDFKIHQKNFRLFNVHLEAWNKPGLRIKQFEQIIKQFDRNKANIVCGDLNTFSDRLIARLGGPILNYSLKDFSHNDAQVFQEIFKENKLINPFEGKMTNRYTRNQLDYILVPQGLKTKNAKLQEKYFGSDHKALVLEVEYNSPDGKN